MPEPNALANPGEQKIAVRVANTRKWLEAPDRQEELRKALPEGMTPERFTRVVMTAYLRTPKLAFCTLESMWLSVIEAAQIGLPLDGTLAALVPYKGSAKLIVMYQGYVQLAYLHPRVLSIRALPVFEGEYYQYREGAKLVLEHQPGRLRANDKLIAAYAVAQIRGGGVVARWMWREEIEEHRARSHGRDTTWVEFYVPMCVKTPIRMISKQIPQSRQLMHAMVVDAEPENERPLGEPPVPHGAKVGEILDAIAGEGAGDGEGPA